MSEFASQAAAAAETHEHDFSALARGVQASLRAATANGARLLTTAANGLYQTYLAALPLALRQEHTCRACQHFIERFGGLVTVADDGSTTPALWDAALVPAPYQQPVAMLHAMVKRWPVTGVFLTAEPVLGTPRTGAWGHLSCTVPQSMVVTSNKPGRTAALAEAEAAMARRGEDFHTVLTALAEFAPATLDTALRLLNTAMLKRSERFIGPVQWLRDLHTARAAANSQVAKANLLWRAIASAPEGYCHPRASMAGTLLKDLASGAPFAAVQGRFNAYVAAHKFQRSQVAPSAGTITMAEKLFEEQGWAPALQRRFARLEDLQTLWTPRRAGAPASVTAAAAAGSLFGHLTPKRAATPDAALQVPPQTMTWEKFARTTLARAQAIEFLVANNSHYLTFTTALHADAPPLLAWDRPEQRNPVSWYQYHATMRHEAAADCTQWGLQRGTWVRVTAVVNLPSMWGDRPLPQHGARAVLLLDGARDRGPGHTGLFNECLRAEVHPVRAVIEAYNKTAVPAGHDRQAASGYCLNKSHPSFDCLLRAEVDGAWMIYRIDRWD